MPVWGAMGREPLRQVRHDGRDVDISEKEKEKEKKNPQWFGSPFAL